MQERSVETLASDSAEAPLKWQQCRFFLEKSKQNYVWKRVKIHKFMITCGSRAKKLTFLSMYTRLMGNRNKNRPQCFRGFIILCSHPSYDLKISSCTWTVGEFSERHTGFADPTCIRNFLLRDVRAGREKLNGISGAAGHCRTERVSAKKERKKNPNWHCIMDDMRPGSFAIVAGHSSVRSIGPAAGYLSPRKNHIPRLVGKERVSESSFIFMCDI